MQRFFGAIKHSTGMHARSHSPMDAQQAAQALLHTGQGIAQLAAEVSQEVFQVALDGRDVSESQARALKLALARHFAHSARRPAS